MRIMNFTSATIGALAVALTVAAWQPAEAGKACDRAGLSSPCIKSNDLKARLNLDEDGKDARLRLRDENGDDGVELDAGSANVTNLFSNDADESNGLVKAWAQINSDGTIEACWRCDTDAGETQRLNTGIYEVDFTPLASVVSGRPRLATVDNHGGGATPVIIIGLADRNGDASSIAVSTSDDDGAATNAAFVLMVY
jgi:hypothetical protein